MVEDTLSDDEHEKLVTALSGFRLSENEDETIKDILRFGLLQYLAWAYEQIDKKYSIKELDSNKDIQALFRDNRWLVTLMDAGRRDQSYRTLCRLKILRPARIEESAVDEDNGESGPATVNSWKCDYKGEAANVLLSTISVYLTQPEVYARHCGVVNSSGTGKSRMVDELAKRIITVPICLREKGSSGFPPPDEELRDWLLHFRDVAKGTVQEALRRFIYALFGVVLERLEEIQSDDPDIKHLAGQIEHIREHDGQRTYVERRQERLASTFHSRMVDGQIFRRANAYRKKFFCDVIAKVKTLANNKVEVLGQRRGSAERLGNTSTDQNTHYVFDAGVALARFIDEPGALDVDENDERRPLIVLAFDESHNLMDFVDGQDWSVFVELRRVLNVLVTLPIFTLFISTAEKFHIFSLEKQYGPSFRVHEHKSRVLPPITETDFDQLAPHAVEGDITLNTVMEDDWMCHLGRPLFGSRYDSGSEGGSSQSEILSFATAKLLGGTALQDGNLDQILACLSVRFPLEFNFANPEARTLVRKQVEHHMRLCISATSGFEPLLSTVGSEPLLAEAAVMAMGSAKKSPIYHLSAVMDTNCVNRGERGELVAALLVMQARDAVAKAKHRRWISVNEFLEELLGDIGKVMPSESHSGDRHVSLTKKFRDARMWFNHVLKVRDTDLINVRHLWKFVTRGAMILCANNQRGVDMVLPVCFSGNVLSRDTVTAVLIQVKNDTWYRTVVNQRLFDNMDPFDLAVFDNGNRKPPPVIRMVFALASKNPVTITSPFPSQRKHKQAKCTSYDIWCAGLHPKTFPVIGDDRLQYQNVLGRTSHPSQYNIEDAYRQWGYPAQALNQKRDILRHFEPLLEIGQEHQIVYEDWTTDASTA